jgi:hypothetical protein
MLAVVKPSPLRLWGFILTVAGGAAIAFGSISDWAAVSLGGSAESAVPTKGIDLWQGQVTLVLGALEIAGILALRFVRPERRAPLALALVAMGLLALGLAAWCVVALDAVVEDTGVAALIDTVAAQLGVTEAEAREMVTQVLATAGVEVQAQAGLWLTVAGAALATIGGLVDLAWVRRKRLAGEAIDPDTLPVPAAPEPPEPGSGG